MLLYLLLLRFLPRWLKTGLLDLDNLHGARGDDRLNDVLDQDLGFDLVFKVLADVDVL
jgi:hypothetical protein